MLWVHTGCLEVMLCAGGQKQHSGRQTDQPDQRDTQAVTQAAGQTVSYTGRQTVRWVSQTGSADPVSLVLGQSVFYFTV